MSISILNTKKMLYFFLTRIRKTGKVLVNINNEIFNNDDDEAMTIPITATMSLIINKLYKQINYKAKSIGAIKS